jgi:serine O-acetyltransferase
MDWPAANRFGRAGNRFAGRGRALPAALNGLAFSQNRFAPGSNPSAPPVNRFVAILNRLPTGRNRFVFPVNRFVAGVNRLAGQVNRLGREVNGFVLEVNRFDKIFVSARLRVSFCLVETVTHLTNQLVASYAKAGGINHLDGKNLPSKRVVTAITHDLLRLLFPGFFDEKLIHSSEIKVETAALLDSILGTLEDEIRKSLEYQPPDGLPKKDITKEAHKLTVAFLESLPRIREILQTDVEAAFNGDPAAASKEEIIVSYPFVEAISVQRLAHELFLKNIPLIPRIMSEWAHSRTGMDLHPGAKIGSHFFVDHCTGTVVGETAIIGNYVKMYHGVTLGAKSTAGGQQLKGKKRHPTIEDRVTIYPGATILGGETIIGAGSTIGGNVFIMDSVQPNSLVIYDGLDMRVLSKADKNLALDFQI